MQLIDSMCHFCQLFVNYPGANCMTLHGCAGRRIVYVSHYSKTSYAMSKAWGENKLLGIPRP